MPVPPHVRHAMRALPVMLLYVTSAIAQGRVLDPLSTSAGPAPVGLNTGARFYIPATPETIRWGSLPNASSHPILTVPSASVITFDTLSHEGLLEDQGRNPVKFFAKFGVPASGVLKDAQAITASSLKHDFAQDGPHIVMGPVKVEGAEPGDLLKVEFLSFTPRVPYGMVSSRHGKGALPGEFPQTPDVEPGASSSEPDRYHSVFRFVSVRWEHGSLMCTMKKPDGTSISFPAAPFLGTVGVAPNTSENGNSIPPGNYGGNLDIRLLVAGSALYLPVQVPGANFFVSDPHMAQGNGEVSLTAVEGSVRATMRLTVLKPGTPGYPSNKPLTMPFAETPDFWIPIGLNADLNEALKQALRNAIDYLTLNHGMDAASAMAYLSAAADFDISEVVDRVKGVHVLIRKQDFLPAKTQK
jgi:acetamidase/formamidase